MDTLEKLAQGGSVQGEGAQAGVRVAESGQKHEKNLDSDEATGLLDRLRSLIDIDPDNFHDVNDREAFNKLILVLIDLSDHHGIAYFKSVYNLGTFTKHEYDKLEEQIGRIIGSLHLEKMLAQGNPNVDDKGNILFGIN